MAALCDPVIGLVAGGVLLLNLPFGYWRAGVPRLSLQWFLAVHLPVPLAVALRLFFRLEGCPLTFAVLAGSLFLGQLLGGRLRRH